MSNARRNRVERKTLGQSPLSRRGESRALQDSRIADSPAMLAQRKQLESAFGSAAQLKDPQDEELQAKTAPEEELQARFDTAQRAALPYGEELPAQKKGPANRTGMPDGLKTGIESLSGVDISDVRVHTNSAQPAQLNALAYAQGGDIHLGPGQESHMAHEAWHIVQQRQGRVKPTVQMQGTAINDDPALEREADVMGAQAAQRKPDAVARAGSSQPGRAGSDATLPMQLRLSGIDAMALWQYFQNHYADRLSEDQWRPYHDNIVETCDTLEEAEADVDHQVTILSPVNAEAKGAGDAVVADAKEGDSGSAVPLFHMPAMVGLGGAGLGHAPAGEDRDQPKEKEKEKEPEPALAAESKMDSAHGGGAGGAGAAAPAGVEPDDAVSDHDTASVSDGDVSDHDAKLDETASAGAAGVAGRLANLEQRIRSLAKAKAKPDHSGHGKGKKIKAGSSRDRHNKGEVRKATRVSKRDDALATALAEYGRAGGTLAGLDRTTFKLLQKAGYGRAAVRDAIEGAATSDTDGDDDE